MEELKFDFSTEENIDDSLFTDVIFDDYKHVVEEINNEEKILVQPNQKRKKVPKNYINNADFCEALVKYKQECAEAELTGKPKPRIPNYIGECFMKLAEGLARRPNFFGYSFKDEMISDGIENCLMYFHNFNPEKTKNPFAYFTQILWFCFVRRIQKEKKQQYIKYKATENFGILDEAELLELGDGQIKQIEVYENMYDFIEKFEADNKIKKANKPTTKKQKKSVGIETFLGDE